MVPRPARRSPRSLILAAAGLAAAFVVACSPASKETLILSDAHLFVHTPSGVGVELPSLWENRYRVADTVLVPVAGLERELSLRMVRADSSLVEEPLLIVRVFTNSGFGALPNDSARNAMGSVVARDGARTVTVRPAPGNPLGANMPDAAGFDSLMITLLGREMKVSLRAPGR
jgi:hypothetical protein